MPDAAGRRSGSTASSWDNRCARLNPPCPTVGPRASVSPGGEGLLVVPPREVQGFPSLRSLRLAGAAIRGAAGPDPAAPELQRGLLHLPQRALENIHPQGGAGQGDGDRLVSKCYGDKGSFSPSLRPRGVGDAGDATLVSLLAGFLPQGQHQQPAAARPHLPAGEAPSWPRSPPGGSCLGAGVSPHRGDGLLIPPWPSCLPLLSCRGGAGGVPISCPKLRWGPGRAEGLGRARRSPRTRPRCSSLPSPDLHRHTLRHLHPDQPGGAAPLEIPLR